MSKHNVVLLLLGVIILEQHLSFSEHFDSTVKRCHGVLGSLSRASNSLTTELLRLAYISLVRTHLEYSSAIFSTASKTQLKKLDVVQKISSRIILHAPRDAHSAPLLKQLNLDSLETRRLNHIRDLCRKIVTGNAHSSILDMFQLNRDGSLSAVVVFLFLARL